MLFVAVLGYYKFGFIGCLLGPLVHYLLLIILSLVSDEMYVRKKGELMWLTNFHAVSATGRRPCKCASTRRSDANGLRNRNF